MLPAGRTGSQQGTTSCVNICKFMQHTCCLSYITSSLLVGPPWHVYPIHLFFCLPWPFVPISDVAKAFTSCLVMWSYSSTGNVRTIVAVVFVSFVRQFLFRMSDWTWSDVLLDTLIIGYFRACIVCSGRMLTFDTVWPALQSFACILMKIEQYDDWFIT